MEENRNVDNTSDSLRAMASDTASVVGTQYTVEETDTIADIERMHGVSWQQILEENKDILKDPNHLQPGLRLKIPKR